MADASDTMSALAMAQQNQQEQGNYAPYEEDMPETSTATPALDVAAQGAMGIDIGRADQHMQQVIQQLAERQQIMNQQTNPSTPGPAASAAFWGGMSGSGYGSFGTNVGKAMMGEAPYLRAQAQQYTEGNNKMMNLRLMAANMERQRQNDLMNTQLHAAQSGYKVGPDGSLIPDPTAMRTQAYLAAAKAGMPPEMLGAPPGSPEEAPASSSVPTQASPVADTTSGQPNKKYNFGTTGDSEIDARIDASGAHPSIKSLMAEYISGRKQMPGGFASRSPYYIRLNQMIAQADPSFDAHRYDTVTAFNKQKQGDTTRALNVAISHLSTLDDLGTALNNGDTQAVNKLKNKASEQFGNVDVTNFDAAKRVVSGEIVKAITASGGGVTDREEAQSQLSTAKSWDQLTGAIKTYHSLLGGQMGGLRQQFVAGMGGNSNWGKIFDKNYLTEDTRGILSSKAPTTPESSTKSLPDEIHFDNWQ